MIRINLNQRWLQWEFVKLEREKKKENTAAAFFF